MRLWYDGGTHLAAPRFLFHSEAFMSILAVCPFCKQGKVRAPVNAVGLSATCPSCYNCFTIVDSKEKVSTGTKAAQAGGTAVRSALATPARPAVSDSTPLPPGITGEVPLGIDVSPPPLRRMPAPAPITVSVSTFSPPEPDTESIFSLAMISLIVAGAALFVSQITHYGRYATVALAMIGVLLAFLALISWGRRKLWPLLGVVANVATILLVTILPGWLALDSWWPPRIVNDVGVTKVRPFDGSAAAMLEGGWLDVSKGVWQRDDVLVKISMMWVGKVQLKGPKDKNESSRDKVLVVGVQISNVGPARRIEYRSWQQPPPAESAPAQVTDSTGKGLPGKKFPEGWEVPFHAQNGAILPGRTHDDWLVFEAPEGKFDYIRLELPVWAFGGTGEPVRLHVPASLIGSR
jgi:hypothetical protein